MLTAMSLPSDRQQAVEAGADGYIVKPFSPRALLEELDRRLP
jgi:two-component system phosphate regulon response regulator PhoB